MEKFSSEVKMESNLERREIEFEEALVGLEKIKDILRELDFKVIDYDKDVYREDWFDNSAIPLVSDGANGIRAVPAYEDRGRYTVYFTNGFDSPSNERRVKVENKLGELGIKYRD